MSNDQLRAAIAAVLDAYLSIGGHLSADLTDDIVAAVQPLIAAARAEEREACAVLVGIEAEVQRRAAMIGAVKTAGAALDQAAKRIRAQGAG